MDAPGAFSTSKFDLPISEPTRPLSTPQSVDKMQWEGSLYPLPSTSTHPHTLQAQRSIEALCAEPDRELEYKYETEHEHDVAMHDASDTLFVSPFPTHPGFDIAGPLPLDPSVTTKKSDPVGPLALFAPRNVLSPSTPGDPDASAVSAWSRMSSQSSAVPATALPSSSPSATILPSSSTTNPPPSPSNASSANTSAKLLHLPREIQQQVLDLLFGHLQPMSLAHSSRSRDWSHAMRHPRARHLSDLALVCPTWRDMVQGRLFRHVKIQGTRQGLEGCADFFLLRPHLQEYVRHIEFWVPVWEPRASFMEIRDRSFAAVGMQENNTFARTSDLIRPPHPHIVDGLHSIDLYDSISNAYKLSSQRSTIDELFQCVRCLFTAARVLTIEGGHCRKPPRIRLFRPEKLEETDPQELELPSLEGISTLVLRGAWNVIRSDSDYQTIVAALPRLREWHCHYSKPKTEGYMTIAQILRQFPTTITHLHLDMESFYNKKSISPVKLQELQLRHHVCSRLGRLLPQLEAVTLVGRICYRLFHSAIETASQTLRQAVAQNQSRPLIRLRALDLVVKNCCRDPQPHGFNDGTGINNAGFIQAFEALVVAATRALAWYPELQNLRIRFLDLEAQHPLLNPYFTLNGDECAGIWNEAILANLAAARPRASFADTASAAASAAASDSSSTSSGSAASAHGAHAGGLSRAILTYPTHRPRSIKVSSYRAFSDGLHL